MKSSQQNYNHSTHHGHVETTNPGSTKYPKNKLNWVGSDEPTVDGHTLHEQRMGRGFWSDKDVWERSSLTTLTCLIGCSIGDFGMIIYLQSYHPSTPMWLQMVLAVIAGLLSSIALETSILHLRENLAWKAAFKTAISMSVLSIIGMEVVMNLTDFMITGGKAQLTSPTYWLAFIAAALAGFLAPLPYNYYQLKKYNRSHH
jgi:drug/metabolite transporter (DMT)-like permease